MIDQSQAELAGRACIDGVRFHYEIGHQVAHPHQRSRVEGVVCAPGIIAALAGPLVAYHLMGPLRLSNERPSIGVSFSYRNGTTGVAKLSNEDRERIRNKRVLILGDVTTSKKETVQEVVHEAQGAGAIVVGISIISAGSESISADDLDLPAGCRFFVV